MDKIIASAGHGAEKDDIALYYDIIRPFIEELLKGDSLWIIQ